MKRSRGSYGTAGASPGIKEFAAEFISALESEGVARDVINAALSRTSYNPSERTMQRHSAKLRSGESPVSPKNSGGRPSVLM